MEDADQVLASISARLQQTVALFRSNPDSRQTCLDNVGYCLSLFEGLREVLDADILLPVENSLLAMRTELLQTDRDDIDTPALAEGESSHTYTAPRLLTGLLIGLYCTCMITL